MSKGTILYVGGFELPDKNAAAHRVLNNAKILRDLGFNVVFLGVDRYNGDSLKFIKRENIQGFECWSITRDKKLSSEIIYYLSIRHFKKIAKKYNDIKLVICYNYQSIAFLRIWNYCKRHNVKLVSDCTEWYESNKRGRNIDSDIRMKYIHKKIDGVICISSYLENYYRNCTQTVIIPPLVDKSEQKWDCDKIDFKDDRLHFVYSGTPGRHKDKLNLILEALGKFLYSYKMHIVGISKAQYLSYYPEHENYLNKLGETVEFLGRVSHLESFRYVKSADFVIFIRESTRTNNAGFPTKFVECHSAGTPVITTDTSDLKNYINQGENGFLIDHCDEKSLEDTLKNVFKLDRKKVLDMKKHCSLVCDEFIYKNYIYKFEFFLNEIGL